MIQILHILCMLIVPGYWRACRQQEPVFMVRQGILFRAISADFQWKWLPHLSIQAGESDK